jgi:hypothetical protein
MDQLKLVNEKEAAKLLNLGIQTLRNWRCRRTGPPYLKLCGRLVRYDYRDLVEYARSRRIVIDE